MKVIHCADLHIDSKMSSHFTKEQAQIRRSEILKTFDRMVMYADQNEVKVIIIAGDLFDTKANQQITIKKHILYTISQNPKIDFLYLRGNHDEDVEFGVEENLPNLKRFSKQDWTCYSYDNVAIYGHEFSDTIPAKVYTSLNLDADRINIVTLHGQIADYKTKEGAPEISLPKLVNKNIDYLALGHIHDFKLAQLDKRGQWCYSGCLEGRGFDECGPKGFVLLDIEDKKLNAEFIPFSQVVIHSLDVELKGELSYAQILNQIKQSTAGIPSKDILQINLVGEVSDQTDIEADSYLQAIKDNFLFVRIKDKTETIIDYEKYQNDVSLKGEFIRLVKEQKDLTESEKSKIILTGIKALSGRLR